MNEIQNILNGLNSIEEKLANVEKEGKDAKISAKAINDELAKLGQEQTKFAQALAEMEQKSAIVTNEPQAPVTLGDSFIKSDSFKNFGTNRRAVFEFTKAESTTQASNTATRSTVEPPYIVPGILKLPDAQLYIEGLLPHVPVSASSVQYVKEGAMTNKATVVAEAADKPETTFTQPSIHTANIVTIAHWTRITKQLSDDSTALAAYINQKLQYGLQAKIDHQLVNGAGGATELPGLLTTGNYTDVSTSIAALLPSGADLFDYALFLKGQMELSNFAPSAFVFNPSDWTALCVVKDKQGRYILGGPQAIASKSLWGIPVVTSSSVPAGKFLMANFQLAATIYDRDGLTLAMSEHDATNFTQNLITLRVERRLGMAVEWPIACYGGDWAVPTAASK